MKTCASCKFVKYDPYHVRYACTRKHKPDLMVPDIIAGGTKSVRQTPSDDWMVACEAERSKRIFGCGAKGKYHQSRYA